MLVSIIIPVYNRSEFLREAVLSILSQSFQDFEIIIVDDGSKHRSNHIVELDSRIKYYYCFHKGVSAARNFGVSKSSGKYIAFLDSDDLWEKAKLEKQIKFLQANPEFKICYTDEKWIRNGEHLNQMKKHRKYHGWIFDKCLLLCIISCSSIIMEKQVFDDLDGFDETLMCCEDYDLWLRMTLKYPIAYLGEKMIIKRGGHADQLSKKYWGMDRFRLTALKKILKEKFTEEQRKLVIEEIKNKYKILINGAWKRKRYFKWLLYKLGF